MEISALTSYLQRTLDLAFFNDENGKNGPLLGWVVVKDEQIVDEGASVAIFPAEDKDSSSYTNWRNGTLFVSVDPFVKNNTLTSFCAQVGLRTYYVATDVDSPVRLTALSLNRRYLTKLRKKRPYIVLKWAETADGFIAKTHHQPYWISNPRARQLVHQWRSQEAAIWVGKNTYRHDNPQLNVRYWQGPNPIRLIVDPTLQLDHQLHVFDQSQSTLCYNTIKEEVDKDLAFVKLPEGLVSWKERVQAVLSDLYQRQVQSVFVEGGQTLLTFLLNNGWWDEARIIQAPITFSEGIKAPTISQSYLSSYQQIEDNTLTIYQRALPA